MPHTLFNNDTLDARTLATMTMAVAVVVVVAGGRWPPLRECRALAPAQYRERTTAEIQKRAQAVADLKSELAQADELAAKRLNVMDALRAKVSG